MSIEQVRDSLREFDGARDWAQFHTPKNLVMAMMSEMGEVNELFQWLSAEEAANIMQNPADAERVEEELADVFQHLVRLADKLDIDLLSAAAIKMVKNAKKHPAPAGAPAPEPMEHSISGLLKTLHAFHNARGWGQSGCHNPKNFVMALSGEAGELIELFQWLTPEESIQVMENTDAGERIEEEIADVFIYLVDLADSLRVDLVAASHAKLAKNNAKYPVEKARGVATKYSQL